MFREIKTVCSRDNQTTFDTNIFCFVDTFQTQVTAPMHNIVYNLLKGLIRPMLEITRSLPAFRGGESLCQYGFHSCPNPDSLS